MFSSLRLACRTISLQILIVSASFISVQSLLAAEVVIPGLTSTVDVTEDQYGVPTIKGDNELDVATVQGYYHARDRFFQMDYFRKVAQGRLGELVGSPALPNDVQLRTLGLGRAALASWQHSDAETKGLLQAYANGVNAWLADNPLPPEYTALELTKVEPWSPYDSLCYAKLLAWSLSFDLDIDATIELGAYQLVGEIAGFDGTALYSEDTNRSQPADGRVTVPGFLDSIGGIGQSSTEAAGKSAKQAGKPNPVQQVSEETLLMAMEVKGKFEKSPLLASTLKPREKVKGSNEWAVSGNHTKTGYPLVANDPHLALNTPATFYEQNLVHEMGQDGYSVSGVVFPGVPGIAQGCNDWICWGSTVHPMDVTDVFQDAVLKNALGQPTHTVHSGVPEPITNVYQSFFVNVLGDETPDSIVRAPVGIDAGGVTSVSARRNNGPLLALSGDFALFVQYTGWGPTFELKFFHDAGQSQNMEQFKAALQYFDVGSQNWIYGDVDGNIGYFTSAENPIRSDLNSGTVDGGVPPWFIRDGTGALNHEWMPVTNPQPAQALGFEIMPYSEMPQTVNPAWGYIANANNDPIGVSLDNNPLNQLRPGGNGIYYLNNVYADFRQGRVDRVLKGLVESDTPVTMEHMKELQGNTQMVDAELTLPTLLGIMSQVPVPPDSLMAQALDVLSTWDYSAPTGLAEGWDAGDDPNTAVEPDMAEMRNSAAATVFAAWRSMLIQNTIDATLNAVQLGDFLPGSTAAQRAFSYHLLNYSTNNGVGASGLPFFSQGLGETVAFSLQQALEMLTSEDFAPAFGEADDILDFAWGKLHRIVFDHPLNMDPLNIPNGGGFMDLAPGLPGLARQGGFQVVDASSHSTRADSLNEFMFGSGPNRRFIGEMTSMGVIGYETIPGGQSGVFLSPNYSSQLPLWLTNSYHPLAVGAEDGEDVAVVSHTFTSGQ